MGLPPVVLLVAGSSNDRGQGPPTISISALEISSLSLPSNCERDPPEAVLACDEGEEATLRSGSTESGGALIESRASGPETARRNCVRESIFVEPEEFLLEASA